MLFSVILTLTLIGIIAGLLYLFLVWNFDHWKKQGVKGPKPRALYGSFPSMITQKRSVAYDMQELYKQYSKDEDFIGVYTIRVPELMILNPDLVHRVFVTDFKSFHDNELSTWVDAESDKIMSNNPFTLTGDSWKERRQEITPGLTPNRIKSVYPVTQEVCGRLIQYLKDQSKCKDSNGIDTKELSLRFTSEVVTDCVLGIKAQSFTDNPTPILEMTTNLFSQTTIFELYSFLAGMWPVIKRFYRAKFFQKSTEVFFYDLLCSAFDMRRKQKMDRVDFLNYILQLQDKKNYSNDQLVSHTMTFLLDGFETSAAVIALCLYQLGKYPIEQEKLHREIMDNVDENGELDFEKLNSLQFLDQCYYESMRIMPVKLFSKKICTEPISLTNRNGLRVQLNPNEMVYIPLYAFCHDEKYFPNPEEFIPERFSAENGGLKKYRDMGVFLPFGDGPRACLGMKFAITQTKAAIAGIVKNFRIKLNPRTRKDNQLHATYFMGSLDGGIWLDYEERA